MADYTISLTGDDNKGVKRDARRAGCTVPELLAAWLRPNINEAVQRYNAAVAAKLAEAYATAAPTDTVATVQASVNPDTV